MDTTYYGHNILLLYYITLQETLFLSWLHKRPRPVLYAEYQFVGIVRIVKS